MQRTTTDTSEKGLETLIVEALTGRTSPTELGGGRTLAESPASYGGAGYVQGEPRDYDREHAVDLAKLLDFLRTTQPTLVEALELETDGPVRRRFLGRLRGEISKRGVIDVLRKGMKDRAFSIDLFYGTPTPGNRTAEQRFQANVFSVTRQLRYSQDQRQLALDLCLFINGLPVATFELKNSLTKQTVSDAMQQYRRDRDPRELLFEAGRCAVHFAVDDSEVWMCAELKGQDSWFLPFNRGWNDGAGNPPNPDGLKTAYLWTEVLTRAGLTDILENYAQMVETPGARGRKRRRQIFPRYHQLEVVRRLLADVQAKGVGQRYLIQHSTGSGKSNSIAWLVHQLVECRREDALVFDSVVVVTDRQVLDGQIRDTIRQFAEVRSTVGHAKRTGDLRGYLRDGKRIVITTIQKFPILIKEMGVELAGRRFAIVIDEAHSSQGGKAARALNASLAEEQEEGDEEQVQDTINRLIDAHKMLPNASYFAFTATPKNRTLELFGEPYPEGEDIKHRPFHTYSMKQAIQEGFILDVLSSYTPVDSYYRLATVGDDDPEVDKRRAQKKLRRFVEGHPDAIGQKARIMVDHFLDKVIAGKKIGGKARAMVVTSGIDRAIQYFVAIRGYLRELGSSYQVIVAFSGEHEYGGAAVTEATLNGFPSSEIPDRIREDPYRLLVVADKFQTGYDEPLLHTMYVDKALSGIKAVQTLSRLNRAHPQKRDTFVLDFFNDAETIISSFERYYRTTILSAETDPNKLHDQKAALDGYQVYGAADVERFVELYLSGAARDRVDPILDRCVAVYQDDLDETGQIDFKGKAKAFLRTYSFLASILPYGDAAWEKLSIFLTFLVPKLPAPKEEDLSQGILDAIDMDSYRVEVRAALALALADEDAEIDPVPTGGGGGQLALELERLSAIIQEFNERFGGGQFSDPERMADVVTREVPAKVAQDQTYRNAVQHSDRQNARIEGNRAVQEVVNGLLADHTQLFKLFYDDESFRRFVEETVSRLTYEKIRSETQAAEGRSQVEPGPGA